jgi:hypothetical protein
VGPAFQNTEHNLEKLWCCGFFANLFKIILWSVLRMGCLKYEKYLVDNHIKLCELNLIILYRKLHHLWILETKMKWLIVKKILSLKDDLKKFVISFLNTNPRSKWTKREKKYFFNFFLNFHLRFISSKAALKLFSTKHNMCIVSIRPFLEFLGAPL